MTIHNYHQGNRNWLNDRVNFDDPTLLGIEIETETKSSFNANTVADEACAFGRILAERDGSLSSAHGVEYIFQATPFDNITEQSFIGQWSNYIHEKVKAWKQHNCGMHISANGGAWTELHRGKFSHFINTNQVLCEKIGGRPFYGFFTAPNRTEQLNNAKKNYEDSVRIHGKGSYYANNAKYRYDQIKSLKYHSRSTPSGDTGSRIEVRFFQSSTKFSRIRRNCEFLDAVRRYSKRVRVDRYNTNRFLDFVLNEEKYYELNKFITRYIRNSKKPFVLVG